MQGTRRSENGWASKLILQHNGPDGPGSIRRAPLDFHDNAARWTYDPKAVLSAFRLWLTDCSLRKPHPQAPPRRPGPPGPPNAGA